MDTGPPRSDGARQAPTGRASPTAGRVGRGSFPRSDRVPTANTHAANELRTIAHELDDLEPGEHEAPRPGGIVWPLVWVVLTIVVAMVIAGWFLIGPPSSAP